VEDSKSRGRQYGTVATDPDTVAKLRVEKVTDSIHPTYLPHHPPIQPPPPSFSDNTSKIEIQFRFYAVPVHPTNNPSKSNKGIPISSRSSLPTPSMSEKKKGKHHLNLNLPPPKTWKRAVGLTKMIFSLHPHNQQGSPCRRSISRKSHLLSPSSLLLPPSFSPLLPSSPPSLPPLPPLSPG